MASVEAFRDEALANVYDKARDEYGVEDPDALIDDFIATYEKWDALVSEVDREDEEALAELAMQEIYNKLPADYGIY